jgi:tetratricopeptide (TPR) repeat protein
MKFSDSCLAVALLLAASPALAVTPPASGPAHAPAKTRHAAAKNPAPAPEAVNTPESLIADAHAAQSRGETELALRLAQSAIVADPARPASYDALGDVYAQSGQPDFARTYYDEALSIDPSDMDATRAVAALDRGSDTRAASASLQGTKTGTP